MSIYEKILQAQKATGRVAKSGYNDFHKYHYSTEADILTMVKAAALEAGLVILTSVTSEIGMYFIEKPPIREGFPVVPEAVRWAKVVLSYQIVDTDTDEKVDGTFDGYAEDKGDKAIYKATTGASKYFLMKFFGVATGDDPENEQLVDTVLHQNSGQNVGQKMEQSKLVQQAQSQPAAQQPNELEKRRALVHATKIRQIQKEYEIDEPEMLRIAGIKSLDGLVRVGGAGTLEKAAERLQQHVRQAAY